MRNLPFFITDVICCVSQLLICVLSVVDDTKLVTKVSKLYIFDLYNFDCITLIDLIIFHHQIVIRELQTTIKELILDRVCSDLNYVF